jgi:hypothetical protein
MASLTLAMACPHEWISSENCGDPRYSYRRIDTNLLVRRKRRPSQRGMLVEKGPVGFTIAGM